MERDFPVLSRYSSVRNVEWASYVPSLVTRIKSSSMCSSTDSQIISSPIVSFCWLTGGFPHNFLKCAFLIRVSLFSIVVTSLLLYNLVNLLNMGSLGVV